MTIRYKWEQAYNILGSKLIVKWNSKKVERCIQFLYPQHKVPSINKPEAIFYVAYSKGETKLFKDNEFVNSRKELLNLFFRLEYAVTRHALKFIRSDFSTIHAGAVVKDNNAILLPGVGRTGKSTLLITLALMGHRPLCDDIVLVDTKNGLLRQFPREFTLRGYTGRYISKASPTTVKKIEKDERYLIPLNSFATPAKKGKLKFIVFPKYKPNAKLKFNLIGHTQGFKKIFPLVRIKKGDILKVVRLFKNVEMFDLTYSSNERAAEFLAKLL